MGHDSSNFPVEKKNDGVQIFPFEGAVKATCFTKLPMLQGARQYICKCSGPELPKPGVHSAANRSSRAATYVIELLQD